MLVHLSAKEQSELSKEEQDYSDVILGIRFFYLLVDFLARFRTLTVDRRGLAVQDIYEQVFAAHLGEFQQQDD